MATKKKVVKKKVTKKTTKRNFDELPKKEEMESEQQYAPPPNTVRLKSWSEVLKYEKPPTHSEENIIDEESKKYPPPSQDKIFIARWNDHIGILISRKNFHVSQLALLEQLCQMYKEAFYLQTFLDLNGSTFETGGTRHGFQTKPRPEVAMLDKVRANIRIYSKAMGFLDSLGDERPSGIGSNGSGGMSGENWN